MSSHRRVRLIAQILVIRRLTGQNVAAQFDLSFASQFFFFRLSCEPIAWCPQDEPFLPGSSSQVKALKCVTEGILDWAKSTRRLSYHVHLSKTKAVIFKLQKKWRRSIYVLMLPDNNVVKDFLSCTRGTPSLPAVNWSLSVGLHPTIVLLHMKSQDQQDVLSPL